MSVLPTFAYTPPTGLNDTTYSPTNATSEADRRAEFQDLFDQITDHINNEIKTRLDNAIISLVDSGAATVTDNHDGTWTIDVSGAGGDMLSSKYVKGTAGANVDKVDHAVYADTVGAIDIVSDTTPQLGGALYRNGKMIYADVYNNGNSGASKTIVWDNGNDQYVTMNASCTFTFTAPTSQSWLSLKFIQDGTGSRNITLPTIRWFGTAPTFSTVAGKIDVINLFWNGAEYIGGYSIGA